MRACSRSSSIRISPTPRSSSVCRHAHRLHSLRLDDPGHRHDLVAAHDERPAFAVGARDLGVDEHVLHLLRAAGEPVAGPPPPYLKPWQRPSRCATAPHSTSPRARPGRCSSQSRSCSRTACTPPPRSTRLEPPARRAARRAPAAASGAPRARAGCSRARRDGCARAAAGSRRRIRPRTVSAFDESVRQLEPALAAERLGLLAPDAEQRPHDAVLAAHLDPLRAAARREPVEDRLDLVGQRVAGRAQRVGAERVANVAQLGLGRAPRRAPARPRRRTAPRTTRRPRRTPRRAARGRRAAPRRGSRARAARGRGRSSRRRRRRGRARRRPARSARAGGCAASMRSSSSHGTQSRRPPVRQTRRELARGPAQRSRQ